MPHTVTPTHHAPAEKRRGGTVAVVVFCCNFFIVLQTILCTTLHCYHAHYIVPLIFTMPEPALLAQAETNKLMFFLIGWQNLRAIGRG